MIKYNDSREQQVIKYNKSRELGSKRLVWLNTFDHAGRPFACVAWEVFSVESIEYMAYDTVAEALADPNGINPSYTF